MTSFEAAVQIQAPPEKVFGILADIPNAPRFQPAIKRIEMLTEGPVGSGSRWKETRLVGKKEAVVELHITQFDAPEAYTVVSEVMGAKYTTVVAVEKAEGGCRAVMTCYVDPKTFLAKMMAGMVNKQVKAGLEDDLQALKKSVER